MSDERQPSGNDGKNGESTDNDRGVTPVLGFVLLVGLVSIVSVGLLVAAGSVTDDSRQKAETERVEIAFQKLDDQVDSIARGQASTRTFDFDLPEGGNGAIQKKNTGRLVIERRNLTIGSSTTIVSRSLGSIVYEGDRATYAYQAGAIWRGTRNSTVLVSAPPFSYSTNKRGFEPTLTLPLPSTAGKRRLASEALRLTANETISPLNDVTVIHSDLVVLQIKSEQYVGWAEYFNATVGSQGVSVDHANETATVEMVVPTRAPPVRGGVISGATAETLKLKQDSRVDSYNSSDGSGYSGGENDTRIIAGGDVKMKQNTTVEGNLEVDAEITFGQNATIEGGLAHSNKIDYTGPASSTLADHVDGWTNDNATVGERTSVGGVIDQNIALVRDNNDNDGTSNVSGRDLVFSGGRSRLGSGAYLLDEIDLDSKTLVLDTTGGPIDIVVLNKTQLDGTGKIEVVGSGRVNIYLDSETGTKDVKMFDDSTVTVPDDRAPQFWLYMDPDAEARLRQRASFTGVIYGPGRGTSPGTEIDMSTSNNIHVFGGVVGDVEPITQEVRIHYDEALATATPIQTATSIPRLTFLHVSVHNIDIEDD